MAGKRNKKSEEVFLEKGFELLARDFENNIRFLTEIRDGMVEGATVSMRLQAAKVLAEKFIAGRKSLRNVSKDEMKKLLFEVKDITSK